MRFFNSFNSPRVSSIKTRIKTGSQLHELSSAVWSERIPLKQENEYTNQQNTQWQPFPTRKQNHCVFLFVHLRTDSQMLKNDLRKMKNQQKAVNEALNEKCMF